MFYSVKLQWVGEHLAKKHTNPFLNEISEYSHHVGRYLAPCCGGSYKMLLVFGVWESGGGYEWHCGSVKSPHFGWGNRDSENQGKVLKVMPQRQRVGLRTVSANSTAHALSTVYPGGCCLACCPGPKGVNGSAAWCSAALSDMQDQVWKETFPSGTAMPPSTGYTRNDVWPTQLKFAPEWILNKDRLPLP